MTLTVFKNEFVCVLGPSGCGKSTLLHAIAGFIAPTSGEVFIGEQPVRGTSAKVGIVFQNHNLFPWKTVLGNITFGPKARGVPKHERIAQAKEHLEKLGLADFVNSYPHELSEGMRQRIGIARALVNEPEVILMDEPFASLDALTAAKTREFLLDLWIRKNRTIVFVTHDVDEAIMLGDRAVVLSARPGHVKEVLSIDIARPRSRELQQSKTYHTIREKIYTALHNSED